MTVFVMGVSVQTSLPKIIVVSEMTKDEQESLRNEIIMCSHDLIAYWSWSVVLNYKKRAL